MTNIKSFVTNLVALGYGASNIGECANNIAGSIHSNTSSNANSRTNSFEENQELPFDSQFTKSMKKIDMTARELAGEVLATVTSLNSNVRVLFDVTKLTCTLGDCESSKEIGCDDHFKERNGRSRKY